jgi:DNA sulfur modification protein DndB
MGTWNYYVTTLTFQQVSDFVSRIDDNLHQSEALKDLIQRSITDNYVSIKNYILGQKEFFFNSLILAVYDDYPNWIEIDFQYKDADNFIMGILDFPGQHKVFPVDGQHRVEGIKEALKANQALATEKITAIFIGHKNSGSGKKRTRRLFTTLNRYAKPVKLNDIIALDEDDVVAIITRELLEDYNLFTKKRVVFIKQKAIPSNNKSAITSVITLYQANVELLKQFLFAKEGKKITKKYLEEFQKFLPSSKTVGEFKKFVLSFWDAFSVLPDVHAFIKSGEDGAAEFRNSNGGSIIFRPVGFLPIVKSAIRIHAEKKKQFSTIFKRLAKIDFDLTSQPWEYVLWRPIEKTMIMTTTPLTELLLLYLYNDNVLKVDELHKLKASYASQLALADPAEIKKALKAIEPLQL